MSLRSRITKIALAVGVTGALLVGAPLAANAASLPVLHWPLTTVSNHTKLDVSMAATSSARGTYYEGAAKINGYKNWKISIVRASNKKTLSSITGSQYTELYVQYYLTDQKTGFPKTTYSSYTALNKVLQKAKTMSTAQLQSFAKTHY